MFTEPKTEDKTTPTLPSHLGPLSKLISLVNSVQVYPYSAGTGGVFPRRGSRVVGLEPVTVSVGSRRNDVWEWVRGHRRREGAI